MEHVFPDLSRLFRPRTVALIGASSRPGSMGRIALENLLASRIEGEVFLVGASHDVLAQRPCYRTIADVPHEAVDVALIVVPAASVPEVIDGCAAKGVRFAIVITSGFGEEGEAGLARQVQIAETARRAGMRVYGPNCPGLTNGNHAIGMTISPSFRKDLVAGPIGLATQGGGLGRTVVQMSRRGSGFGVGLWGSAGNESDLEIADLIGHLSGDPEIRAIAAIAEGFRSGDRFVAAAAKALERGKPLVMLKVGRSEYGRAAAASHTAAIAGSDEINSAVFRKHGVIRVLDVDELHETASLAIRASAARGGGIVIFGFSGGAGGFASDLVGAAGLHLARFGASTLDRLKAMLPSYAAIGNPIDVTTRAFTEEGLHEACLEAVCQAPETGTVVVPIPGEYGALTSQLARDLVHVSRRTDALIVPVWMSSEEGEGLRIMLENGLAPFRSISKAVAALARIEEHRDACRLMRRPALRVELPSVRLPDAASASEVDAKRLLAAIGIASPTERVVRSVEEAVRVAQAMAWPLSMKVVSADLPHKTEVGGVALGVPPAEAGAAYERILQAVAKAAPDARIDGVLIGEMIAEGEDFVLGVHRDPTFGPILTVGLGGILVELVREVRHFPLPLRQGEVSDGLGERMERMLAGFRGKPALDRPALIEAAEVLGAFAYARRDEIGEIEVNPLRVLPSGRGVVALDALLAGHGGDDAG